ncbi:hypothetical protein MMC09_003263 [Bachmanniomyces sp. S44760]|nr:hypothetical protein [Bachmanniomyces sp. S44760]
MDARLPTVLTGPPLMNGQPEALPKWKHQSVMSDQTDRTSRLEKHTSMRSEQSVRWAVPEKHNLLQKWRLQTDLGKPAANTHKSDTREKVWRNLRRVAKPDSRFHYNFAEFIPDFEGSETATDRLMELPAYKSAKVIFITPDNCLEDLRLAALEEGKIILVTSYALKRGFFLLEPAIIPPHRYEYASTLDGLEKVARPISLWHMQKEGLKVDMLVTGTGAINMDGVRFGKGHGYFDLEWSMLYAIGIVSTATPCLAIVHDCQVLTEKLEPEDFDTVCDVIITPTRTIQVDNAQKPVCGIMYDKLQVEQLDSIPPLEELQVLGLYRQSP